jgi:predicted GIY-YIG superfamily endonuclease
MKPFYVYMLQCRDNSFYVGHTDDLDKRLAQHQSGLLPGYTSTRRPLVLAWSTEMPSRAEAIHWEITLKGWSHAKKAALARGDWANLREFAKSRDENEGGK